MYRNLILGLVLVLSSSFPAYADCVLESADGTCAFCVGWGCQKRIIEDKNKKLRGKSFDSSNPMCSVWYKWGAEGRGGAIYKAEFVPECQDLIKQDLPKMCSAIDGAEKGKMPSAFDVKVTFQLANAHYKGEENVYWDLDASCSKNADGTFATNLSTAQRQKSPPKSKDGKGAR